MIKRVYYPSKKSIVTSPMFRFMEELEKHFGKRFTNYSELHRWSVENSEVFWKLILEKAPIRLSAQPEKILTSDNMFNSTWFTGSKLNFAETLLKKKLNKYALVSHRENAETIKITYNDLNAFAASAANYLQAIGVKKGDRIAAVISNIPEAVVMMLAATSLGAIWSSSSPEFGEAAILDRFEQIEPVILVGQREYSYNGKYFSIQDKIRNIKSKIPSVKKIIWAERFFNFRNNESYETPSLVDEEVLFQNLIFDNVLHPVYHHIDFNDPVYIMYSSGTTGKPKCIIHGAGGTLLQHYKELHLHSSITDESKILFFTTCGWMMWNWLVSSLMLGAEVHLYDGSPVYPNTSRLWDIADAESLTHLGVSPKFLSLCKDDNLTLKNSHRLENLQMILSTGAPLTENYYHYIYDSIKEDIHISSISGGTDIISCFMLGNPLSPVFPGEIQGPGLGMAVEVWKDNLSPVTLEQGELVCVKPFPSMPIGFWGDEKREKYEDSYFSHFPGFWRHGDFIEKTSTGGFLVFGRSDTTLNPGGVRIGTAEIYNTLEGFVEISDSVLSSVQEDGDASVCLFLVLKNNGTLDTELTDRIKKRIKAVLSPRHVPKYVFQVNDVPRTINGKKVEIAVTRILQNMEVTNEDSITNRECLAEYRLIAGRLKKA
ncbi:MAG: acetoacetate-CoA ligase [Ignavibacteriales bacterium]